MNAPSITTAEQTQAVTRTFDLGAALKDSLRTALITLGLSIPILAYKTDQSGADLFLTPAGAWSPSSAPSCSAFASCCTPSRPRGPIPRRVRRQRS
ncbi:hypothetical protein [Microvirga aerophila]|uniref:hypothetical protein n=1 Tax=Microvirga aerophila TaxID=670291 RepID=UPI000DEF84DF|nr:hypothetical protein [Microvirga aerophila]